MSITSNIDKFGIMISGKVDHDQIDSVYYYILQILMKQGAKKTFVSKKFCICFSNFFTLLKKIKVLYISHHFLQK